jgi:hypothetical protein
LLRGCDDAWAAGRWRRLAGALEDIARYVGHAKPTTTAGYVKRLGRRPEDVARRAADVLDGQADDDADPGDGGAGVRNHPAGLGSNGGSNGAASALCPPDGEEP